MKKLQESKFTSEIVKRFVTNHGVQVTIMYEPYRPNNSHWKLVLRIKDSASFEAIQTACEGMEIPAMGSSNQSGPGLVGDGGGMIYLLDTTYLSTLTLIGGITHIDEYVASPDQDTELEKFYGISVPRIVF